MHSSIISNPIIDRLPAKLKQYIKPQNYEHYTSVDQAVWRYVMRKNVEHLKKVAHESYLEGLDKTGITIDRIPSMYGMNRILKDIGWAAVAVDGLIPSDAFMEFQAYNVLVIASDIRQLDHIEYTPTPDIIHESAGHAPILANREYAEYLRHFGHIGSKAISSALDNDIYVAVRELSILKEKEGSSKKAIKAAEQKVDELQKQITSLSEMTQIRNLHWWTVEYGLIGTTNKYKQYGAGLLSSIGESKWCMSSKVKKLPYTMEASQQNFDVTRPQPQLYVTPDFAHLNLVLEEFANGLSLRKGGFLGVQKLIDSKSLGTIELSTGLQISGVFTKLIEDENNRAHIAYFGTGGRTVLANREKQLTGHGTEDHPNGFESPLGRLKGYNLDIEDMSPRDLECYHIHEGKRVKLEFESGVIVDGRVITGLRNVYGKIKLIYFDECLVKYKEQVLFTPSQGIYNMAVGKEVISAFAGPADYESFDLLTHQLSEQDNAPGYDKKKEKQITLFEKAANLRQKDMFAMKKLQDLHNEAMKNDQNNWLLFLEIFEIAYGNNFESLKVLIDRHLNSIADQNENIAHLIGEGKDILLKESESSEEILKKVKEAHTWFSGTLAKEEIERALEEKRL